VTDDHTHDHTSWINQKNVVSAVILLAGAIGGGSLVGYTVEPLATTELRVQNGVLTERTEHLESRVTDLKSRVAILESLVSECRDLVTQSRREIGGSP